jgi:hypothetical protein
VHNQRHQGSLGDYILSFNLDKFQRASYTARTEKVEVKALAEFFGEGEEPVFLVRGLAAAELQRALDASSRQSSIEAVVKAISSTKDQTEMIRKAIGMGGDTPPEIAKRVEMFVTGCVEPKVTHADVAKIAENFAIEFFEITNKIVSLTGQGSVSSKSQPSSQTSPT